MFGIVLVTTVTIMHAYVLWRASAVPFLRERLPLRWTVAGGVLLWLMFLAGRIYSHGSASAFAAMVEQAGMIWMGVLLLTMVSLLAVELATGFGVFMPGLAPSFRGAALVFGAVLSVIAVIQGTRNPVIRNFDVEVADLPAKLDGTAIIGLSDMHLGAMLDTKWLEQLVAQVLAERPDMIVLLGDIFEGHGKPAKELIAGLRRFKAPMGIWAVLGNHEFHGGDDSIISVFGQAGVTVLRNQGLTVRPGLVLAGVDDLTSNRRSGSEGDLVARTLATPAAGATILLSHTPWNADGAAAAGADLMLCGHTHGGQIWPFGYLVQQIYPLLAGRYEVDGMTVIVSRGAGTWGPRMRLWQPGEIVRVTLRAKKKVA